MEKIKGRRAEKAKVAKEAKEAKEAEGLKKKQMMLVDSGYRQMHQNHSDSNALV